MRKESGLLGLHTHDAPCTSAASTPGLMRVPGPAACPDLRMWKKLDAPVIPSPPRSDLVGFRDPYVFARGGAGRPWKLLLGSGVAGRGGTLLVYRAASLTSGARLRPPLPPRDLRMPCVRPPMLSGPHAVALALMLSEQRDGNARGRVTMRRWARVARVQQVSAAVHGAQLVLLGACSHARLVARAWQRRPLYHRSRSPTGQQIWVITQCSARLDARPAACCPS